MKKPTFIQLLAISVHFILLSSTAQAGKNRKALKVTKSQETSDQQKHTLLSIKTNTNVLLHFFSTGEYQRTSPIFKKIYEIFPLSENPKSRYLQEVNYLEAVSLFHLKKTTESQAIIEKLRKVAFPPPCLNLIAGYLALEQKDFQNAKRFLNQSLSWNGKLIHFDLSDSPFFIYRELEKGRAQLELGEISEAKSIFESTIKAGKQGGYFELGLIFEQEGKLDKAEEAFKASLANDFINLTERALNLGHLATFYYKSDRFSESLSILKEILGLPVEENLIIPALLSVSFLKISMGEQEEAKKNLFYFQETYKSDTRAVLHVSLADLAEKLGETDIVLNELEIAENLDPSHDQKMVMGSLYYSLKDYIKSKKTFLSIKPELRNNLVWRNLATLSYLEKDYEKAEFYLKKAAGRGCLLAKKRLVFLSFHLNRIPQAINALKELTREPNADQLETIKLLISILINENENEEYIRYYERLYNRISGEKFLKNITNTYEKKDEEKKDPTLLTEGYFIDFSVGASNINLRGLYPHIKKEKNKAKKDPLINKNINKSDENGKLYQTQIPIESIIKKNSKEYETFCQLFSSISGEISLSQVQIHRQQVQDLVESLGGQAEKGKGRHQKLKFLWDLPSLEKDSENPMDKQIYILSSNFLRPYQIQNLRELFLSQGFYPESFKHLLLEKGFL